MRLIRIPAGSFMMGFSPGEPLVSNHNVHLRPIDQSTHPVHISKPYYLGVFEVTQEEFQKVLGVNPSQSGVAPQLPVDSVTYEAAVAFCQKLSQMDRTPYRLPTEAEWEFACRAGITTSFYTGMTLEPKDANFFVNRAAGTTPVGTYPPNPFGLYDMHGNVRELTYDEFSLQAYQLGGGRAQVDPGFWRGEAAIRVARGGDYSEGPINCRSSTRCPENLRQISNLRALGFRVMTPAR
jgi:formylglycine-generating enzyme required for sulfatase activity